MNEDIRKRVEAADDPIDFEATFFGTHEQNKANAHFLSHSMADIRHLLTENARLQAELAQANAEREAGTTMPAGDISLTVASSAFSIKAPRPANMITFRADAGEVGTLNIVNDQLVFKGNADEAAALFFEAIKRMVDSYVAARQHAASDDADADAEGV